MATQIRRATEQDRGLVKTFSDKFPKGLLKSCVVRAEEGGFRVIPINGDSRNLQVLMPSGYILVRDLFETGVVMDESIERARKESGYKGDRTPNGELATAIDYGSILREKYVVNSVPARVHEPLRRLEVEACPAVFDPIVTDEDLRRSLEEGLAASV